MLPLRGKILNVERKDEASLYKNTEIQSLITGLGLGMKVTCANTLHDLSRDYCQLCDLNDFFLKVWV